MWIHIPIVEPERQSYHLSTRPVSTNNLIIGLLDNTKKNANLILAEFARLFTTKLTTVTFRQYRKHNSSTPYTQIETVANECNLVINAHGD